ncbi:MAG TPA: cytochrome c [Casimicrobiaceae bacterium]|nr:cytochrome c [Casimicrobiaceae bacterium]
MSTTVERSLAVAAIALACAAGSASAERPAYGFGSTPSADELARFTSPLPDGRGLPAGSGTVEQGKALYAEQCASCHGANLQGGVGDKLIGGRGTLVNDDPKKSPVKTIESYWPYATTIFDYVKRAMPFGAPDSLSNDQVYAVTAYILAEAKIIPADAVIDAKTLPVVKMPNRDGFIPDPRPEQFAPIAREPRRSRKPPAAK